MRDSEIGEDVLRMAIARLPDQAFITLDRHGMITSWNVGAERLFGWSCDEAVHGHVASLLGSDASDFGIASDDLVSAARGDLTSTRLFTHRDGTTKHGRMTILASRTDSTIIGYIVVVREESIASHTSDVGTCTGRADDSTVDDVRRQLADSNARLAVEIADRAQVESARVRLLRRLLVAQEEERRRLARNLHDGLGQRMTALKLMLEALGTVPQARDVPRAGLATALEMLASIDRDIDFIAWELTPAALDDAGLAAALDAYVNEWSQHAGVAAVFHATPDSLPRFAPEVEVSIYRIAQEGLNNVAKHAHARTVNVLLQLRGEILALVVEDDGVGLPQASRRETTIGMTGMQERAHAVGGTLEVEPTPGGGTTVIARIPTTGAHPGSAFPPAADDAASAWSDPDALSIHRGDSADDNPPALDAIRDRVQELQRAVGARDDFIATVAHELRNPVAPLAFQVRLALNRTEQLAAAGTGLSVDWTQTQLRGIERRLHRLLETLDRLLDVSRLSTGRIDLQLEPMNLGEVMREVVEGFEAELAVARCPVTLSERGTATGVWDRFRVEQICRNLLSNAIRFGAGRPIEVAVSADGEVARLLVRDHGIGIAPEQQAKIFERFERGIEQRHGGFGIGLWIVRTLCVALGGIVTVESALGDGACFTVSLPQRQARAVTDPALPE